MFVHLFGLAKIKQVFKRSQRRWKDGSYVGRLGADTIRLRMEGRKGNCA